MKLSRLILLLYYLRFIHSESIYIFVSKGLIANPAASVKAKKNKKTLQPTE